MKRETNLMLLRAALCAGMLAQWRPGGYSLPLPGSPWFWQTLLGRDIVPYNEDGSLPHAWLLGPLFLIINSLTWFPLTVAVFYFLRRRKTLVRGLGALILLAGAAYVVLGCLGVVYWVRHFSLEAVPIGENYIFFFAWVPAVVLGTIAILVSYRMLKTP